MSDTTATQSANAPVLGPVNVVTDYAGSDEFVRKHTPFVEVIDAGGKKMVSVRVGKDVPHPNVPDHYITWIELQVGGAPIARFDLSPVATDPSVGIYVNVDPGTTVTAMEHCNLHGLWTYSVTV